MFRFPALQSSSDCVTILSILMFHSKFHLHHIPIPFLRRLGFSSISFLFARDWFPPSSAFEFHIHFHLLALISHPSFLVVAPRFLAPFHLDPVTFIPAIPLPTPSHLSW